MTNEGLARETAGQLWVDLPDRETCTPAEWHKAVEPLILKAIEASQVDVQGLVEAALDEFRRMRDIHKQHAEKGPQGEVAESHLTAVQVYASCENTLRKALSAHPTSEAQCEAGMEEMGFHRVLPADVVEVLKNLEWKIDFLRTERPLRCTCCRQLSRDGHRPTCKLDALLKKYTSAPSLPAEEVTLRTWNKALKPTDTPEEQPHE